jgi:hypothetical protein
MFFYEDVEKFVWSCYCHPGAAFGLTPNSSWRQKAAAYHKASPGSTWSTCPFRGCHVGEFSPDDNKLDELLAKHQALGTSLVLNLTGGLEEGERQKVVRDFERAHQQVSYIIRLKIAPFKIIPGKFLGLANHSVEVARICCVVALGLVQDMVRDGFPVSKLFYLVRMLCFRSKEGLNHLHEQFMQFLKGQAIEHLPLVLRLRNKLRCVPCVETLVEALHKKSKQEGLGRYNIGAATVSCRQRLSRLSYRLENEAGFLQRLAGKCDSTRSMHDIVVALGISTHPALLKKFAESRYIAESGGDAFCDSLPSGADL